MLFKLIQCEAFVFHYTEICHLFVSDDYRDPSQTISSEINATGKEI